MLIPTSNGVAGDPVPEARVRLAAPLGRASKPGAGLDPRGAATAEGAGFATAVTGDGRTEPAGRSKAS